MPEVIFPVGVEKRAAVLVIHSWWGLTGSFRDFGRSLAVEGFVVGLADLFAGKIATSAEEAKQLRGAPRREPMYKTLKRDIGELQVCMGSASPIGVIGFSMGGHWAVWLSQQAELPVGATVLYYAARAGSFDKSHSSYQAHFAENDDWVSTGSRRRMERQIAAANCRYASFDYPGTGHWFAEKDRHEDYVADAANLALERTVAHLTKTLPARPRGFGGN